MSLWKHMIPISFKVKFNYYSKNKLWTALFLSLLQYIQNKSEMSLNSELLLFFPHEIVKNISFT